MKCSLLLAAAVPAMLGQALDTRAIVCKANGNNCQRGVGGTNGRIALATRLADCASFLSVTVTPAATTETVTATTTSYVDTITLAASLSPVKRQATETPSVKPTYATYCSDEAAYYSACICASVTPATTTAPTPTETYTATTQTVLTCAFEYSLRKRGWNGLADFVDYAFH